MNDNLNAPVVDPFMDPKLTDDQLAKLVAVKPESDVIGYVTSDEVFPEDGQTYSGEETVH